MRVLMFGWEYPPYNSGGLGVACLGLSSALAHRGDLQITFVLPKKLELDTALVDFEFADVAPHPAPKQNIEFKAVNSLLGPYLSSDSYVNRLSEVDDVKLKQVYGSTLFAEVERYGILAEKIARNREFDVIHAHDWLSALAGITAKQVTGKPFIMHIHATEYDRTGGSGAHKRIFQIEQMGMRAADRVVAVSEFTRQTIITKYGINPSKVSVVHNGINLDEYTHRGGDQPTLAKLKQHGYKIVLFVGRITMQKGPEYFVRSAAKVIQQEEKVKFVMAGSGDMEEKIIRLSAEMGIADKIIFPGFVRGDNLRSLYKMADAFVMPSISEPFGLVALEAVANETPVIVSKQSGAAEVMDHALKVDFWDDQGMADAILGVVRYGAMYKPMTTNSYSQALQVTWEKAASTIKGIYQKLLA